MSIHKCKRVLVAISGGIAAYKSPILVRRLRDAGCEVRVVMSDAATEFITPLTLQAVSGHPVHRNLLDAEAEAGMGHIELARWPEQVVIAPASANTLAKLASGRADDLLSAVVLATAAEVVVAPAMNQQMWQSPATTRNLKTLTKQGVKVLGPSSGEQACGEDGPGRMLAPEEIARAVLGDSPKGALDRVHALVTAGPTWEALDPVRGLTNRSSGKMGYAMAQAALDLGARVTLVSGAVALTPPEGAEMVAVQSAQNMYDAVQKRVAHADLFIAVAAVADYRPEKVEFSKIKKAKPQLRLELVRNPDILAGVASLESPPFTIGFAAESDALVENARAKIATKGADVLVANIVDATGSVFGSDENAVTIIAQDAKKGAEISLSRAKKYRIAVQILTRFAEAVQAHKAQRNPDHDSTPTDGDAVKV